MSGRWPRRSPRPKTAEEAHRSEAVDRRELRRRGQAAVQVERGAGIAGPERVTAAVVPRAALLDLLDRVHGEGTRALEPELVSGSARTARGTRTRSLRCRGRGWRPCGAGRPATSALHPPGGARRAPRCRAPRRRGTPRCPELRGTTACAVASSSAPAKEPTVRARRRARRASRASRPPAARARSAGPGRVGLRDRARARCRQTRAPGRRCGRVCRRGPGATGRHATPPRAGPPRRSTPRASARRPSARTSPGPRASFRAIPTSAPRSGSRRSHAQPRAAAAPAMRRARACARRAGSPPRPSRETEQARPRRRGSRARRDRRRRGRWRRPSSPAGARRPRRVRARAATRSPRRHRGRGTSPARAGRPRSRADEPAREPPRRTPPRCERRCRRSRRAHDPRPRGDRSAARGSKGRRASPVPPRILVDSAAHAPTWSLVGPLPALPIER